ncbi:MAG: SpoIIE family protein phosphatase [Anaerolineae bacterium]
MKVTATPEAFLVVLSDGLGSGVKANILSTLTAQIVATMVEQGASMDEVMETLAATLPECQVRKLAYATFAALRVERGRYAYLVEYDCPPLILIRDGQVVELPAEEREIHGRRIREVRFQLNEGDYMVLVSDGYIHAGVGGLYRLGWGWKNLATAVKRWAQTGGDAYSLIDALTRTCLKLYEGKPGDDATAVAMRVRPAIFVTVLTGPPRERADDRRAVEMLMQGRGYKIICGGTTAQLAARELGQELEIEWVPPSKRDKSVPQRKGSPPTARLKGVDLVTEGIITLSQTVVLLENAQSVHDLPAESDAATRLTRMLLSADFIHLIVGTAINPNQIADLLRGEPMRMVYVKELVRLLEQRGKRVVVHYL